MNRKTVITLTLVVTASALLLAEPATARDLGAAANNAVSMAKTVTRALSLLGLLVGAGLMQLPGLAEFGRRTLAAGLVGCLCAFAGPTLVKVFESIFGGL
jgi:hypothetical protein